MYNRQVYIPRLLDAPERFIFFSAYEVVSLFAGLMFGNLTGQWLLGLGVGIACFIFVRKLDQKGFFDSAGYVSYWYMPEAFLKPLQMNYFSNTPSYVRELVG